MQKVRFIFPTLQDFAGQNQRITAGASTKSERNTDSPLTRTIGMQTEHLCVTSQALAAVSGSAVCQASYTQLSVGSRLLCCKECLLLLSTVGTNT